MSQLDGKVSIELGVKDWRLNFQTKLKGFVKLLTEEIEVGEEGLFGSDSGDEVYGSQEAEVNPGMVKSSSQKCIKEHSQIEKTEEEKANLS